MDSKKMTREQFDQACEEKKQQQMSILFEHTQKGVIFVDCNNTYIEDIVIIGAGTTIYPGVILSGKTVIGKNCKIGHNTRIVDSSIGDDVEIQSSEIAESTVGRGSKVGPFAYIRPNSHIGENVKLGDFVEIKNSTIGDGTKIPHLTYVGDADLGKRINLGCGVVFVNYDGTEKHRSTVEDDAFIGCNTNLISPVMVG